MCTWGVKKEYLGCLLVLAAACHPVLPSKETPLQQIKKTLEAPGEKPLSLPSSVKEALLPSMQISQAGASSHKVEPRFDVVVSDVPARDFFLGLVEGTPHNITVHSGVTGALSLQLAQVTVPQVLEIVRDLYGYEYDKTPYGYKILSPGLRTRIFQINYLNLQRFGESQTRVSAGTVASNSSTSGSSTTTASTSTAQGTTGEASSAPPGTQIRTTSSVDFWKILEDTLRSIIGMSDSANSVANSEAAVAGANVPSPEERVVVANRQSGVILARATPVELRAIEEYLDKTQLSIQRQVILEAKILQVDLKDGYQAGIDWNLLARFGGGRSDAIFAQGLSPLDTPSSFGPGLESGRVAPKKFPPEDLGIADKLGGVFSAALNLSDFKGLIQLLETQGNVQVLSSPQVSTINNQKAVIRVGNDEFFVTGINISSATNSTGTATDTTQTITPVLTPLFSGIALDVTPQISESGYITLHIHPSVTEIQNQQKIVPLGTISDTSGSPTKSIDLALSQVRESDTIVRAQSGQMVVIGGLIQNKLVEKTASLPWLGAIPYLGAFFRQTQQQSIKSELVILLRPRIVDPDATLEAMGESLQRFRVLDRGFHFGSKPEIFGMKAERGGVDDGE